jgi:pimeloyl-ACP methyl ester carboxylesterase
MPPPGDGPSKHAVLEAETCKAPQTTYEGRKCRLELLGHTPATFDEEFLRADAWMADQPKSRDAREKYAKRPPQQGNPYRDTAWEQARSGRLQMPILIYAAKQDTLSWDADDPHAMMRGELAFFDILGAKNPRVKMIVLNDGGHFMYREHPAQFAADLTSFIEFANAPAATTSAAATAPQDERLVSALAKGDRQTAAALMDEAFRFVDRHGMVRTRVEVLDRLAPASGAEAATDVQSRNYGDVVMVTGNRRLAAENASVRFLHIWVKRPAGWRAFVYHENTIFAAAPASAGGSAAAAPPAAPVECENPCKVIPYDPKSPDEQAVLDSWKALETAVTKHDAAGWAPHVADEFLVIRQQFTGDPTDKAERIAQLDEQKKTGAVALPGKVQWLQVWLFGDAAVMVTRHIPALGPPNPYRVTRVWVKRGGTWQMAISQQTGIEDAIGTASKGGSYDGAIGGLEAKFVDIGGVRARYYEAGKGEPMVLIHGGFTGGSSTANVWSRNIPGLAKRYHVYAVDRLGSGLTGNPAGDDYGNPAQVAFIYEFIKALKLEKVHLVGHSAGGAVAFYTATEHPEIARTLTIVAVGPANPRTGEPPNRLEPALKKCPDQEQYEGLKCRVEALGWLPDTFDDEYWAADVYMAAQPNTKRARASATAAGRDPQTAQRTAAYREKAWERAKSGGLPMPVLLYAGKQDVLDWSLNEPTAMLRAELNMFDIIGTRNHHVEMVIVNEGGHFMYREHPELFNRDLANFIDFWSTRAVAKPSPSSNPSAR